MYPVVDHVDLEGYSKRLLFFWLAISSESIKTSSAEMKRIKTNFSGEVSKESSELLVWLFASLAF